MRRLFRSFERLGVDYLLISGQASILYGAATFSEDVDIWVAPTEPNLLRLKRALAAVHATYYKHTPPMTRRSMLAGHGFHFIVPTRPVPLYLDVMGQPPRVGGFAEARKSARSFRCPWGTIPVVSIEDLVEMKRTQCLSDYDVISNLAQVRAEEVPGSLKILGWAATHSFRAPERLELLRRAGRRSTLKRCRLHVTREIARLQKGDAKYWRLRIHAIRRMRRAGTLVPEGCAVCP